jgi:thiol-disulfide isomerase/thioredoxin
MINLKNINTITEFTELLKSKQRVIINLKTTNCPLCVKLEKVMENLESKEIIHLVNLQNLGLQEEFITNFIQEKQLKGVPVLMVYENSEELTQFRKLGFIDFDEFNNYLKIIG